MPSSVMNKLNQIRLAEGNTSLLKFYDHKGNTVGYNDTNISGVDAETGYQDEYDIKNEDPQDEYDTTDVYINQDENQDGQEDHK